MSKNPAFPTLTFKEAQVVFRSKVDELPKDGARFKVIRVDAHYIGYVFIDTSWIVVDCANNHKFVRSSPDDSGPTSAYSIANELNVQDQLECKRLNAIKLQGFGR